MELKTKICPQCGKELPRSKFYTNNNTEDGLSAICRSCACSKNGKRREYTGVNPELVKFTPRELIAELRARGYKGEMQYTQTIKL